VVIMQRRAACIGIPWDVPLDMPDNTGTKHIAQIHFRVLASLGSAPMPPDKAGKHRGFQRLYYSLTNHLFQ